MSDNATTLKSEIKKELDKIHFKRMFFMFISLGAVGVASAAVILLFIGVPLKYFALLLIPLAGASMTMTALPTVMMIGITVGFAVGRYYKPQVMWYVEFPKRLKWMEDIVILFGSFLAAQGISETTKTTNKTTISYPVCNESLKGRIRSLEGNVTEILEWIRKKDKENIKLKQSRMTISDLTSKVIFKQKELDKFQTKLTDF